MPHPSEAPLPVFVDQTKKYVDKPGERDYVTTENPGENPLFRKFIDEETYKQVLSGVVVECVDMLVYNPGNDSFLIGTRQQEPQAGDWVIGGRMRAGETTADSAARNMKRELGLEIDRSKLRTVGHYNLIWDTREQPPLAVLDDEHNPHKIVGQAKGCHMVSNLELYTLSDKELEKVSHNEEYSMLRWLKADDVLSAPAGEYHPCLVDMFEDGLEAATTPEPATTVEAQRLRLYGAAATAQTAVRNFEAAHPKQ